MTNTNDFVDVNKTMEAEKWVKELMELADRAKQSRCDQYVTVWDREAREIASLILSLTERIKELESELNRLHNMLSAVSNPSANMATYADFIHASLKDGAKKKPDSDEPYTADRPYCD